MTDPETRIEAPTPDQPQPGAAPTPVKRQRLVWIRCRPVLMPGLSGALLVSLVLAGFLGFRLRHQDELNSARRQALVTATNYAAELTTYDFTNLDAEFANVLKHSTGAFQSEYTAASASLRDLIAKFKATASGKVLDTAVVSSDTTHAQVLLFVDQTVTNSNSTVPRIDRSRMRMGLEKHGGSWLISSLDLV